MASFTRNPPFFFANTISTISIQLWKPFDPFIEMCRNSHGLLVFTEPAASAALARVHNQTLLFKWRPSEHKSTWQTIPFHHPLLWKFFAIHPFQAHWPEGRPIWAKRSLCLINHTCKSLCEIVSNRKLGTEASPFICSEPLANRPFLDHAFHPVQLGLGTVGKESGDSFFLYLIIPQKNMTLVWLLNPKKKGWARLSFGSQCMNSSCKNLNSLDLINSPWVLKTWSCSSDFTTCEIVGRWEQWNIKNRIWPSEWVPTKL